MNGASPTPALIAEEHLTPVAKACQAAWDDRAAAAAKTSSDLGNRKEVTSGKHLDGVEGTLASVLCTAGVPQDDIATKLSLPCRGTASKNWDLVGQGEVLSVVELRSQAGADAGKNYNNRVTEAIGQGYSIGHGFASGRIEAHLGRSFADIHRSTLFLLEDHPDMRKPKKFINCSPDYQGLSVAEAYVQAAKEWMEDGLFENVGVILVPRVWKPGQPLFTDVDPECGLLAFLTRLAQGVAPAAQLKLVA